MRDGLQKDLMVVVEGSRIRAVKAEGLEPG